VSGYNLIAIVAINDQVWCTYREAINGQEALVLCLEEFPEDEGYINHWVENQETGEITIHISDDVLPLGE
jgi:hypothetical protein